MPSYGVKAGISDEELDRIRDIDIDFFEIYTRPEDVKNPRSLRKSIDQIKYFQSETDYDVRGVHMPRVNWSDEGLEAAYRTSQIASELDTYTILDSTEIPMTWMAGNEGKSLADEFDYPSPVAVENQAASSAPWFRKNVLENGYNTLIDTAHLRTSVEDSKYYHNTLAEWITEYDSQIQGIHFVNSSEEMDGYALNSDKGVIDMEETFYQLQNLLDDDTPVILEFENNGDQKQANRTITAWKDSFPPLAHSQDRV